MAEQILKVHKSKLTYATLKKMISLVEKYTDIKKYLTYYFPNILEDMNEWYVVKETCVSFLENMVNWTGSSPSNSSPDYIKSMSVQQINDDSVVHLYNRLSGTVSLGDESVIDYAQREVWVNILSKIVSLLNMEDEYTVHRQLFNAVKDDDDVTDNGFVDKSPGQLSSYTDCEMPLPENSKVPDKANYYAFRSILGNDNYYTYLPVYDIGWISANLTKRFSFSVSKKIVDSSPYTHDGVVGCVLSAITPTGEYLNTVTYVDANTFNIDGIVTGTEVRILELQDFGEGTDGVSDIILRPEALSPDNGQFVYTPVTATTSSFETSGGTFDLHEWTTWEFATDSGFSNVVMSSIKDRRNLTSFTFDAEQNLPLDSFIYWRAKFKGRNTGESDWTVYAVFQTPETWDCELGTESGGGILAGSVNGNCLVVGKKDSEPIGTQDFSIVSSDSGQTGLTLSGTGHMVYRTDQDSYYINSTGTNDSMDDWVEIKPQGEPNYDIYVESESEQLSMSVVKGNIAIRTDTNECYINISGGNSSISDWVLADTPVKIWWLAKQYCTDLSYGGYSDWKLPDSSELNYIQFVKSDIDTADSTGSFENWYYWTADVDIFNNKYNAWIEDFDTGIQETRDRDAYWYYVRPVRRL